MSTVHILCPVHNGVRYLPALLASLQAQEHTDWRLWMVDDASTDGSQVLVDDAAHSDARITRLPSPSTRLGALGAFAWLWARVPAEARYIAFADQDDVCLPGKLSHSLAALYAVEEAGRVPVLVHTDLEVVDAALRPIAPSYWRQAGVVPDPPTFRRIVAQNVATGCTMLMNRALYEQAGAIPVEATMHDAWVASAAALLGRVVSLPASTVRYRQHGHNTLGARASVVRVSPVAMVGRAWRALVGPNRVRAQIAATARQAALLQERFAAHLSAHDREFLAAYAAIPSMMWWTRKWAVARWHCHPEHGWLRNVGVIWRA